jgi:hypothetical protein
MVMMRKHSPEDRAQIIEAARAAIEGADSVLAKPRPQAPWPAVEDKLAKWKREADEQERRFAAERAAPRPLTDYEAAQLQRAELAGLVDAQKQLVFGVLAELVAELRHDFEQKVAALAEELGQLRADRTLDRALAKGEVIDLPALPLMRKQRA